MESFIEVSEQRADNFLQCFDWPAVLKSCYVESLVSNFIEILLILLKFYFIGWSTSAVFIYFGVKWSKVKVTRQKQCRHGFLTFCTLASAGFFYSFHYVHLWSPAVAFFVHFFATVSATSAKSVVSVRLCSCKTPVLDAQGRATIGFGNWHIRSQRSSMLKYCKPHFITFSSYGLITWSSFVHALKV